MHELICSSRLVKPTYVLEESSGFVVPVVAVTLDSESVFTPGGGKETCVVGVAANGGGHKIKNTEAETTVMSLAYIQLHLIIILRDIAHRIGNRNIDYRVDVFAYNNVHSL